MVSIISSGNFKWPYYVKTYLEISSILGSISSQAFSIDCLINDFQINENPIHLKALIFVILPFILWIMVFFILISKDIKCLIYLTNKKNNERFICNDTFTYLIIISNFLQPFILQELFNNLKCKKIGDNLFLYLQMNFNCDSKNHLNWVIQINFNILIYYQ